VSESKIYIGTVFNEAAETNYAKSYTNLISPVTCIRCSKHY